MWGACNDVYALSWSVGNVLENATFDKGYHVHLIRVGFFSGRAELLVQLGVPIC